MDKYQLNKAENVHRMARIYPLLNLYDSDSDKDFPRPVITWSSELPFPNPQPKYFRRKNLRLASNPAKNTRLSDSDSDCEPRHSKASRARDV